MKRISGILLILCAVLIYSPRYVSAQSSGGEPFRQEGIASWYGTEFDGRPTASGEIFNSSLLTAAHPSLPFGTLLNVTNKHNNKSVTVKVNDRGPFVSARIIDISRAAAEELDMITTGTAPVIIRTIDTVITPGSTANGAEPLWTAPPETPPPPAVAAPPPPPPPAAPPPPPPPQRVEMYPAEPRPPAPPPPPPQQQYAQPPAQQPQYAPPPPPQQQYAPPPPPQQQYAQPPAQQPQYAPPPPPPQQQYAQPPAQQPQYAPPPPPPQQQQYAPPPPPPPQQQPQYVQPPRYSRAVLVPSITPSPQKKYRLQVGSYKVARNAMESFERLKNVGLNPKYEQFEDFYRVVLPGVSGYEINSITEILGSAGFREVLIREER